VPPRSPLLTAPVREARFVLRRFPVRHFENFSTALLSVHNVLVNWLFTNACGFLILNTNSRRFVFSLTSNFTVRPTASNVILVS